VFRLTGTSAPRMIRLTPGQHPPGHRPFGTADVHFDLGEETLVERHIRRVFRFDECLEPLPQLGNTRLVMIEPSARPAKACDSV
jgi:hypothetical protein